MSILIKHLTLDVTTKGWVIPPNTALGSCVLSGVLHCYAAADPTPLHILKQWQKIKGKTCLQDCYVSSAC